MCWKAQDLRFFLFCGTGVGTQGLRLEPLFVIGFFQDSLENYVPGFALNCDLSDLCLLSS
jgi:hypothetical protein